MTSQNLFPINFTKFLRTVPVCTSEIAGNAPSSQPLWFFHAAC